MKMMSFSLQEFVKMFNDSQSFYYSEHSDLTNTIQRNVQKDSDSKKLPIWKTVWTFVSNSLITV